MAFWNDELRIMLDDCQDVFGDTVSITIESPGAFNAATGQRALTSTTGSLSAIRTERRVSQTGGAGGPDVTETVYHVRKSELSEVRPGALVLDGTRTLEICRVEELVNDQAWALYTRSTRPVPVGGL